MEGLSQGHDTFTVTTKPSTTSSSTNMMTANTANANTNTTNTNTSSSGYDTDTTASTSRSTTYHNGENQGDTLLMKFVQNYEWEAVLERILQAPHECPTLGSLGRTPLHVACDHDAPPMVIQALTRAYPQAVLQVGTSDMNPLHIVCSSPHASVEVVKLLLLESQQLAPQMASMTDVDGDTPLHSACRCGASLEVLKVLLHVYPQAVHMRDSEGLTPLLRLWVREVVLLGNETIVAVSTLQDLKGPVGEAWKKTMLLLYCAEMGTLKPTTNGNGNTSTNTTNTNTTAIFRPLHAAARHDCPRRVVQMATAVYRDQLLVQDEHGRTPLLVACQAPVYKFQDIADDGSELDEMLEDHLYGDEDDYDDDNDIVVEEEDQEPSSSSYNRQPPQAQDFMDVSFKQQHHQDEQLPSVIDIFVQAAPQAVAICDAQGKSPLEYATATGKKWKQGLQALSEAQGSVEGQLSAALQATVQLQELSSSSSSGNNKAKTKTEQR